MSQANSDWGEAKSTSKITVILLNHFWLETLLKNLKETIFIRKRVSNNEKHKQNALKRIIFRILFGA